MFYICCESLEEKTVATIVFRSPLGDIIYGVEDLLRGRKKNELGLAIL